MPGGSRESYDAIGPILEDISAHVGDEPCCTYIGTDGAGHLSRWFITALSMPTCSSSASV
jgi:6-phosphogluconate dehydrogenase